MFLKIKEIKNIQYIIIITLLIFKINFKSIFAYEATISREEGHFIEHIELEDYDKKEYIDIDDMVKAFKMVKYWHPANQKVIIEYERYKIEMFIDNPKIIMGKNDEKKILDMHDPLRIINGKIMIPLSFIYNNIAEITEMKIIWDPKEKILKINKFEYNVTNVRVHPYPNFIRVAIDITKELDYKVEKQLSSRLAISITGGIIDTNKCKITAEDNLIKEIVSFQNKDIAMIYVDIKDKSATFKNFLLTNPYRIVIDITGTKIKEKVDTTLTVKPHESPAFIVEKEVKVKEKEITAQEKEPEEEKKSEKSTKINTIVIDPGHGGKDPGAIGPTGLKEKDAVIKIAKELRNLIVKYLGTRVILTREGDYFVSLEERTHIANFNHADLFISIHTNASFRSRSSGFEVFYFSASMNIDPYALAIVKKENSVMRLEDNKSKMNDIDIIVYDILQTEYVKESKEFALITQASLDIKMNNRNRGIKQGPFFVLRNARMPSILVESSFITNRRDEDNLRKDSHLNEIAKAVYNSIVKYKKKVEKK